MQVIQSTVTNGTRRYLFTVNLALTLPRARGNESFTRHVTISICQSDEKQTRLDCTCQLLASWSEKRNKRANTKNQHYHCSNVLYTSGDALVNFRTVTHVISEGKIHYYSDSTTSYVSVTHHKLLFCRVSNLFRPLFIRFFIVAVFACVGVGLLNAKGTKRLSS